jgi:hypothetical protein
MDTCFVMQPFDGSVFDSRYKDIIKPAIKKAGLSPYRVDEDMEAVELAETIKKNIKKSKLCLAEITTNNPNVWYELGFATACLKYTIMICSDERDSPYPFDVRHMKIIKYSTKSVTGYRKLKQDIINAIKHFLSKESNMLKVKGIESLQGLDAVETLIMMSIIEDFLCSSEGTAGSILVDKLSKYNYTPVAVALGIEELKKKTLVKEDIKTYYDETLKYFKITKEGIEWLSNKKDTLPLQYIDTNVPF